MPAPMRTINMALLPEGRRHWGKLPREYARGARGIDEPRSGSLTISLSRLEDLRMPSAASPCELAINQNRMQCVVKSKRKRRRRQWEELLSNCR